MRAPHLLLTDLSTDLLLLMLMEVLLLFSLGNMTKDFLHFPQEKHGLRMENIFLLTTRHQFHS